MKNKVVSFISYLFLAAQFVLSIVISLIEKTFLFIGIYMEMLMLMEAHIIFLL